MVADVSVAIVNFNTTGFLGECIDSIRRGTKLRFEVLVVDNGSADDSCRKLCEKQAGVVCVTNDRNVGYGAANNQAFAMARGRYFVVLNPDTVVLPGALDVLVGVMDRHPEIGICGPKNVDADGNLQLSCDHFPSFRNTLWEYLNFPALFPKVKLFRRQMMRYWDYAGRRNVDRIMGSCLVIRPELFSLLEGFDERYFMYFEETDLCYRARRRGYEIVYVPEAGIVHYGGASSKTVPGERYLDDKIFSYYYRSKYYFIRKHYGAARMLAARALDLGYGVALIARNALRPDRRKRSAGLEKGKLFCAVACR